MFGNVHPDEKQARQLRFYTQAPFNSNINICIASWRISVYRAERYSKQKSRNGARDPEVQAQVDDQT